MLLVLTTPLWGFPDRRMKMQRPGSLGEPLAHKSDNIRETGKDCQGKCATSIAQKAAAEAKAAQAAQNAAGAQAAHMVCFSKN